MTISDRVLRVIEMLDSNKVVSVCVYVCTVVSDNVGSSTKGH